MEDIIKLTEQINGQEVTLEASQQLPVSTDSLIISKVFEKDHNTIKRAIKNLPDFQDRISTSKIALSKYTDARGKVHDLFVVDRKTFTILILGFTGKVAYSYKVQYVDMFDSMEQKLKEQFVKEVNERCSIEVANAKQLLMNEKGEVSLK